MRGLLREFWTRPVAAMKAGCELFVQRMDGGQRIDGVVSRIVHTLSRAPGADGGAACGPRRSSRLGRR